MNRFDKGLPRRLFGWGTAVAMSIAISLAAPAAAAAGDESVQAAADALYGEGRALLKAGKNAEACAKFEASLALSPAASTMLNIAKCHEQDGKIATAWADYTRALSLNGDTLGAERRKQLEELARNGLHALEPRLPRLRVALSGAPSGAEVLSDGRPLPAAALGEALPTDPGAHEVRVRAPGYREETRRVMLEEGKTAVIEIALQRADAPRETPAGSAPARGWMRPSGIALTALGAAGLAIGAVVGGISLAEVSDIKSRCDGTHCLISDRAAGDTASRNAALSTAAIVTGGVVAATGVVLLVLSSPRKSGAAPASDHGGALGVIAEIGLGRIDLKGTF